MTARSSPAKRGALLINMVTTAQSQGAWLAVDVGNSRIKWAVARRARHGYKLGRCHACDKDSPSVFVKSLGAHADSLSQIRISHVGSDDEKKQLRAVLKPYSQQWLTTARAALGVTNRYQPSARLGIDRWLALIAAWQCTRAAAVVVSAGTAVTIDALNARGVFAGGIILPGLVLMNDSLQTHTRLTAAQRYTAALPKNTASGIASGTRLAICGAVSEFQNRFSPKAQIIITGGDASRLLPFFPKARHEPHLVLQGMVDLYNDEHC